MLHNIYNKLLQLSQEILGVFMIGLKLIRKQKRLTQQKVAIDLNISRESLSYYENGKRQPPLEFLVALSKYFNVSIDYLITGKEFKKV